MDANVDTKRTTSLRPAWMDLAIALPVGILLYGLTDGWQRMHNAVLALFGGPVDPSRLQIFAAHITSHWLVPALVVFLVLRFTRIGAWLAPNWFALGGLLLADAILGGYVIRGLYLASQGEPPYFGQASNQILTPIVTGALIVGLVSLVASTLWHRHLSHRGRARAACRRLLTEV